jgi:hypothetical protein
VVKLVIFGIVRIVEFIKLVEHIYDFVLHTFCTCNMSEPY